MIQQLYDAHVHAFSFGRLYQGLYVWRLDVCGLDTFGRLYWHDSRGTRGTPYAVLSYLRETKLRNIYFSLMPRFWPSEYRAVSRPNTRSRAMGAQALIRLRSVSSRCGGTHSRGTHAVDGRTVVWLPRWGCSSLCVSAGSRPLSRLLQLPFYCVVCGHRTHTTFLSHNGFLSGVSHRHTPGRRKRAAHRKALDLTHTHGEDLSSHS